MIKLVSSEAQGNVICGGDFNVRLCPILDTSKSYFSGEKKTTKNIKLVIEELGPSDIWRDLNPTKRDDTSHPHSVYLRLDYFLRFQRDLYTVINHEIDDR